jgi:SM-20-related protein
MSSTLLFRISPDLPLERLGAAFRAQHRLHIPAFLEPAGAEALHRHLAQDIDWGCFLRADGRLWEIPAATRSNFTLRQEQDLAETAFAGAERGYTSFYECRRGISLKAEERAADPSILARYVDFMNSSGFLAFARRFTGVEDIAFINAQATRFVAGHFITPHTDGQELKSRKAAYVLNLTRDWQPQWGGQLQFIGEDGHVAAAYVPRFNALNIFLVPQMHAVSLVAPFAGGPRLSITGWFWTST